MAEHTNVEKPFPDKLRQLKKDIDQNFGIPKEPEKSLQKNNLNQYKLK